MRKWTYYRMHIPGNCSCHDQRNKIAVLDETCEMMELEFLRTISRWNRLGQGHWQYWSTLN